LPALLHLYTQEIVADWLTLPRILALFLRNHGWAFFGHHTAGFHALELDLAATQELDEEYADLLLEAHPGDVIGGLPVDISRFPPRPKIRKGWFPFLSPGF
jgi:hypothetical protein